MSSDVPALTDVGKALTVAQLTKIIDSRLGESADRQKPYMPVWGPVISPSQVTDLVAYLQAGLPKVKEATPVVVPREQGAAVAGAALYVRDGCINCHGPSGLGGVPNPLSEDEVVPALSGQDFRQEFNTDEKIKEVIRSGSVIGKPPIASMPHWGGHPGRGPRRARRLPEDAAVALSRASEHRNGGDMRCAASQSPSTFPGNQAPPPRSTREWGFRGLTTRHALTAHAPALSPASVMPR